MSGVDVQQIPAVTQQTTGEGQAQENGNADSEVIMAELVDVIEEQQNDETVVMNEPESQNLGNICSFSLFFIVLTLFTFYL